MRNVPMRHPSSVGVAQKVASKKKKNVIYHKFLKLIINRRDAS